MFSLTSAAAEQIHRAASQSETTEWALRVAARRGTEGSTEFGMGFDEPREGDMPLQMRGVNLLIGPPSQALLDNTLLDFVEVQPGHYAFVFLPQDPEPTSAGGCGSSGAGTCGTCQGGAC